MKNYRYVGFLIVFVFSYGCAADKKSDFDIACVSFEEIVKLENYSEMSPQERNEEYESLLSSKVSAESNALVSWLAVSHVDSKERYKLYQEAALSTGLEDWGCESMSRRAHEIGQF